MAATKTVRMMMMIMVVCSLVIMRMVSAGGVVEGADHHDQLNNKEEEEEEFTVVDDEEDRLLQPPAAAAAPADGTALVAGAEKEQWPGIDEEKIKWGCWSVVPAVLKCWSDYFKFLSEPLARQMQKDCCKSSAQAQKCIPVIVKLLPNFDIERVRVECALQGWPF